MCSGYISSWIPPSMATPAEVFADMSVSRSQDGCPRTAIRPKLRLLPCLGATWGHQAWHCSLLSL
jgi:hypothetical protein